MERITAEQTLLTSFQDADPMGVIYHGHYFRYFEEVRSALLGLIGYNYFEMHASGYMYPIIETRVKYIRPIRFQQEIRVVATLMEWEHWIRINYVIYDAKTGERLTKGHTCQVAVNMETREMCFVTPPIFGDKLRAYCELQPSS